MAQPNWYNENAHRSFPFLRDAEILPNSAIVDAGFLMGIGSGYVAGEHKVWLSSATATGDTLSLVFATDAPGLTGVPLVFTRDLSDPPRYVCEYADTNVAGGCALPSWSGFLVTGRLLSLVLPATGLAYVEPALVRSLSSTFVRSISVANADRTRYESPEGCQAQTQAFEPQDLYVRDACVQGPLRFAEGHNLTIRHDVAENALVFEAGIGLGDGEPVTQVPVFVGETAPAGSNWLEGGLGCGDVFRSINGIGGRVVSVSGVPGSA